MKLRPDGTFKPVLRSPLRWPLRSALSRLGGSSGGGGASDPYPWFTALDLNTLDLQGTYPVVAPAEPVITGGTHNVTDAVSLALAVSSPGRIVNITASFDPGPNPFFGVNMTDFDFVIQPGVDLTQFRINAAGTRIRFRGPTLGTYSGGLIHVLKFGGGLWQDVVVDGIGLAGPALTDGALQIYNGVSRMALTNCRVMTGQDGVLCESPATSIVVAGNSFSCGNEPGGPTDPAWCFRVANDGPIVHYRNYFRTTRFAALRAHPQTNTGPVYTRENVIVNLPESQIWAVDANQGGGAGICPLAQAENNDIYGSVGTLNMNCRSFGGNVVTLAEATSNRIRLTGTSDTDIDLSAAITAVKTGNVYSATAAAPGWTDFAGIGAGDPTGLNWDV